MKAINTIYNNLKSGKIYGYFERKYGIYFSEVLSYDENSKMFFWNNHGRGYEKATKKELLWILEEIFHMSPEEFIRGYDCYSLAEIHKNLGY